MELFKDLIKRLTEKSLGKGFLGTILAGTLTGTLSLLIAYPLDNWRTQALSKSECSSGMESSSLFDVYSGFGMSVLGIGLYRFSYFALYDGMFLLCECARVRVFVEIGTPLASLSSNNLFIINFFWSSRLIAFHTHHLLPNSHQPLNP